MLTQADRLAWLLDNSIRIPILNYRIGLDAIIGLIPGVGDAAGLLMSSYIVLQAIRLGTARAILMRMMLNIAIEALVGTVPVLGDLFDATFKSNMRNVRLLNLAAGGTGNPSGQPVGKGTLAVVIAAFLGIVLITGAGFLFLFWWLASLFSQTA
jgi:hypothetical protein